MKKQVFNPYMPSWEYIPDGEPHVYGGRVYVYGSHDFAHGWAYCLGDYVCWSAPVSDLTDWHYEGVIYGRGDDPMNADGSGCLYAPDVTQGPDGRFYLYYVLDNKSCVGVAVCDTPAGRYQFLGNVHYPDGQLLGHREGDEPQFDPAVLTEGDVTYLYTGFCSHRDESRHGPMCTVLESDMLTVREAPRFLMPSLPYSKGSGYEGHEFFEAPSIRKYGDTYYFVYSSIVFHELCYATSKYPDRGYAYRGVIVSNNDLHIGTWKDADMPSYYGGNNHGGLVEMNGKHYIFYHRHTEGTNFSRQAMAEEVRILEDGSIPQVEMTSCGLNGGPLEGKGTYPAHIACTLFTKDHTLYTGGMNTPGMWINGTHPRITQDEADGQTGMQYIANMVDTTTAGYKYFDLSGDTRVTIRTRSYATGVFELRTSLNGPVLATFPVRNSTIWVEASADVHFEPGVQPLFFTFKGHGYPQLLSFTLE